MSNSKIIDELISLLANSQAATNALLDRVDMEMVVYEDPIWQVKDVVWHIATWDRQVAKSILAFVEGGEYAIPDFDENDFNDQAFRAGGKLTSEQVRAESSSARQEFLQAVSKAAPDQASAEFLYPWGDESGDIVRLVNYMVEHDKEHREEIEAAAKS